MWIIHPCVFIIYDFCIMQYIFCDVSDFGGRFCCLSSFRQWGDYTFSCFEQNRLVNLPVKVPLKQLDLFTDCPSNSIQSRKCNVEDNILCESQWNSQALLQTSNLAIMLSTLFWSPWKIIAMLHIHPPIHYKHILLLMRSAQYFKWIIDFREVSW